MALTSLQTTLLERGAPAALIGFLGLHPQHAAAGTAEQLMAFAAVLATWDEDRERAAGEALAVIDDPELIADYLLFCEDVADIEAAPVSEREAVARRLYQAHHGPQ